jgi:hypothetical protein
MSLFCSSCGVENVINAVQCKSCNEKLARPNQPIQAEIVDDQPESGSAMGNMPLNLLLAGVCLIYIINPTAGFLEFIPDNLPIIGNIDEATATGGLLLALSNLGWIPWMRKK